jgi:hypothetical protein
MRLSLESRLNRLTFALRLTALAPETPRSMPPRS